MQDCRVCQENNWVQVTGVVVSQYGIVVKPNEVYYLCGNCSNNLLKVVYNQEVQIRKPTPNVSATAERSIAIGGNVSNSFFGTGNTAPLKSPLIFKVKVSRIELRERPPCSILAPWTNTLNETCTLIIPKHLPVVYFEPHSRSHTYEVIVDEMTRATLVNLTQELNNPNYTNGIRLVCDWPIITFSYK